MNVQVNREERPVTIYRDMLVINVTLTRDEIAAIVVKHLAAEQGFEGVKMASSKFTPTIIGYDGELDGAEVEIVFDDHH